MRTGSLVGFVAFALEDDEIFAAVPGEVHHMRTELGDAVERIGGGDGWTHIQFYQIPMRRRFNS